jgi:hypothetical protein
LRATEQLAPVYGLTTATTLALLRYTLAVTLSLMVVALVDIRATGRRMAAGADDQR